MASKEDKPEATKEESAPTEETSKIPSETEQEAKASSSGIPETTAPVEEEAPTAAATEEAPTATPASNETAEDDTERSRRVYVGNLAWSVSGKELKEHMKSTGLEVTAAYVMTTPDGLRSKGCGIAEFATSEAAQQAVLTLNDSELGGRQIFVREDREDRAANAAGADFGSNQRSFSTDEQAKSRRVYVGNLSWDVSWQDLKDHMRQAGEVVHAEVITEHTGRSKGCGLVEYSNAEEAQQAITTLTDTDLKGRLIFVREDRETSSQPAGAPPKVYNTSVYIRNLPPETSWQDLKDHMRRAGNVASATILTNASGEPMGCGIAVYHKPQDAARAIRELQQSELNGSPIFVREDRMHPGRGGGGRGYRRPGRGYGGRGGGGGIGAAAPEGTQLFVGNLSFKTTWKELKDHFRQCGDVKRAEVKMSPNGSSKGFGIVQFANKADADEAISRLNGSELMGRELEVRPDQKNRY